MINNIAVYTWKQRDEQSSFYVKDYKYDAVFIAIGREGDADESYDTFLVMREDGSIEVIPAVLCKIIKSVKQLGVTI